MNAKELIVSIKTRFDGKGTSEANRQLGDTKKKTEQAAGGFSSLGKSATTFKGVMEKVNQAMAGFGVLALLQNVMRLVQAFKDAKKANEDLLASITADNAAAQIEKLNAAHDAYTASIAASNAELKTSRTNMDDLISAERRLQDARLGAQEEAAVGAIDLKDPLYAEKEASVRARFGRLRAEADGRRGVEDVSRQEDLIRSEIARLEQQISGRDGLIADYKGAALEYSGRSAAATRRSVQEQNKWSIFGKGRNWVGGLRAGIEQYAGYADTYGKQASAALSGAAAAMREQEADRAAIKAAQERLAVLGKVREAAAAEGGLKAQAASRTVTAADFSVSAAGKALAKTASDKSERDRKKEARMLGLETDEDVLLWEQSDIQGRLGAARSRAASARTQAANFRPGMTWGQDGRMVGRGEVEAAAKEAAREAEQLNRVLSARLAEISRALKATRDNIDREREAD